MHDFIIKGNLCCSESRTKIAVYERSYLICEGGRCGGIFRELPERYSALPVTDYGDSLILPGLVDLHIHAPQYAYRGLGMDMELLSWLERYAFPEERKYADLSYAERAYSIFADSLRRSATTRAVIFGTVHRSATELLMDRMEGTGLVSFVGKVNMDRNAPESYAESTAESAAQTALWLAETADRYRRTRPIITPRFVPSCSDELLEELGRLAQEHRTPVQSHLSENPGEIEWVRELCPDSRFYGEVYDRYELLGSRGNCIMAHCVYSSQEETALLRRRGVFVAHCPASNMNVASGIAPIRRYLESGIRVGLGSDVAGGHTESLFTAMVEAIQCSKLYWRLVDDTARPLSFDEAFYLATEGGGEFFGKVGVFEPGYELDAVVLDDSALPHPQELSVRERLERAVYLGADRSGLVAKFCRGEQII